MREMDKTPAEDKTNLVKNIDWIGSNNKGKDIRYPKNSASLKVIHKIRDYKRFIDSQSDEELEEELGIPINALPQIWQKAMQQRYSKKSSSQEEKVVIKVIPKNPKEKSRVIELPKKLVDKHMDEYFSANLDRIPSDRNPSEEFIKEAFSYSIDQTLKSTEVHEVGRPLLQEAVEAGNEELVKELLLKKEIDVNEQAEGGWTALLYAAAQGYPQILRLLLDAGTNPDIGNLLGRTPLIFGAHYGNLEVCKILLEYGANIDAQDGEGLTALMIATRLCLIDAVEIFLKAGANINIKDRNSMTALDHAKKCKQGKIVKLIRKAQNSRQSIK
jgi:ankyrin repeat protein